MDKVKQAFSTRLVESLKQFYGGRLPSIARIARDFSLKSPHLAHVSSETIRKWIRGESLPHISRMQVLIDWFGPQIAAPFEQPKLSKKAQYNCGLANTNGHRPQIGECPIHDQLIEIIDELNERECQGILDLAILLAEKHNDDFEKNITHHNGQLFYKS